MIRVTALVLGLLAIQIKEGDSQMCVNGFVSVETLTQLATASTSPSILSGGSANGRQWIVPGISFTCSGTVTKWIVAGEEPNAASSTAEPEIQIWRETSSGSGVYTKVHGMSLPDQMNSNSDGIYEFTATMDVQSGDALGLFVTSKSWLDLYYDDQSGPAIYYMSTSTSLISFNTGDAVGSETGIPLIAVELMIPQSSSLLLPTSTPTISSSYLTPSPSSTSIMDSTTSTTPELTSSSMSENPVNSTSTSSSATSVPSSTSDSTSSPTTSVQVEPTLSSTGIPVVTPTSSPVVVQSSSETLISTSSTMIDSPSTTTAPTPQTSTVQMDQTSLTSSMDQSVSGQVTPTQTLMTDTVTQTSTSGVSVRAGTSLAENIESTSLPLPPSTTMTGQSSSPLPPSTTTTGQSSSPLPPSTTMTGPSSPTNQVPTSSSTTATGPDQTSSVNNTPTPTPVGADTGRSSSSDSTGTIAAAVVVILVVILLVGIVGVVIAVIVVRRKKKRYTLNPDANATALINPIYSGAMELSSMDYKEALKESMYEVPHVQDSLEYEDIAGPSLYSELGADYDAPLEAVNQNFLVPTDDQRKTLQPSLNIYSTLASVSGDHEKCFSESAVYWAPASNQSDLYEQLAQYKFREIPRPLIKVSEQIGMGNFGEVNRALWTSPSGSVEVAVKTLKPGANEIDHVKFLQEAAIMGQFHHPNIIMLHGVVTLGEPVMIVLEYMPKGDLRQHLMKLQPIPGEMVAFMTPQACLDLCCQIASGMDYLSARAFVHRDLAARNILVAKDNTCKISDFGMARDLQDEEYYRSQGGKLPVKWTALEAINYKKYTTASDVWSYGALMYEIWSLGHKPFEGYTNLQVVNLIRNGMRLPPPPGCPRAIYKIMIQCWHPDPGSRPSFSDLLQSLSRPESELFHWTEEDTQTHPQANVLGALLETGKGLYLDLQATYKEEK